MYCLWTLILQRPVPYSIKTWTRFKLLVGYSQVLIRMWQGMGLAKCLNAASMRRRRRKITSRNYSRSLVRLIFKAYRVITKHLSTASTTKPLILCVFSQGRCFCTHTLHQIKLPTIMSGMPQASLRIVNEKQQLMNASSLGAVSWTHPGVAALGLNHNTQDVNTAFCVPLNATLPYF